MVKNVECVITEGLMELREAIAHILASTDFSSFPNAKKDLEQLASRTSEFLTIGEYKSLLRSVLTAIAAILSGVPSELTLEQEFTLFRDHY